MSGQVVPTEWVTEGVPRSAMAAFAEGCCPVHFMPLDPGMFQVGGKGSGWYAETHWISGGWCDHCLAWWSRPYGRAAELLESGGLAASYGLSYGSAAQ